MPLTREKLLAGCPGILRAYSLALDRTQQPQAQRLVETIDRMVKLVQNSVTEEMLNDPSFDTQNELPSPHGGNVVSFEDRWWGKLVDGMYYSILNLEAHSASMIREIAALPLNKPPEHL